MKLELETNSTNFPFLDNNFVNEVVSEEASAKLEPFLQKGIKAAKEGNRTQAKQLLLQVTETDPANEDALMWLASISEYPEELLGHLSKILSFNPANQRAADWAKSTRLLLANDFMRRGIEASKNNQKEFARQNFLQAVTHNEGNETGWLWLASVSDSVEEKNVYLRKVLNLNPENENALMMLKSVKNQNVESLFVKSVTEAVANNNSAARETVKAVLENAPGLEDAWVLKSFLADSFDEKIECYEKILEINAESPLANVNWTALLEIMARAEQTEVVPPVAQPAAAVNEQPDDTQEFYELNLSDEMPEMSKPTELNAIQDTAVSAELSNQESENVTDLSVEKEHLVKEEASFDENHNVEDENPFPAENDAYGAPRIEDYYKLNEEEENDVDLLQYEPEKAQHHSSEVSPEDEYFNQPETSKTAEDFPTYSYDFSSEDSGEINVSELPSASVSYFKDDEDILVTANADETDYNQSFEEEKLTETQGYFGKIHSSEDEDSYTSLSQNEEESVVQSDENVPENFVTASVEYVSCPYCKAKNEPQEFVCNACHTMLTLSDLEMLLAHQEADKHILRYALEELEAAGEQYDLDADELKVLGIGYINLKHLRLGFAYLQDALKLNPNNVVLSSQVNALAIRLAEIEEQESIHSSMPKNRRILVVDDSATVRKLISAKLSKSGHEVLCAIDGIEALEKINEVVPDLILLDINMPRMDGYQVCKLIRNNETTKEVPVVMISGKDGFFDKVRGRMAGTTGYITKPFGPETLMKTVETYIV